MPAFVEAPVEMVEAVAGLRFPVTADRRLQSLMDRNTEGLLTSDEREELAALVDLSEAIAVMRGQALHLLGRAPR